jgi:hypothetical protein
MSESLTQAPEGLLNYDNCSLKELRAFIEDRTGAAANEREILAAHLRKMDQTRTFPRFMELPPELRVNIYEALLVDNRARDEKGWLLDDRDKCKLHTAVLRTSKQVYSEARPVLYSKNKFSVRIGHTWRCSRDPGSRRIDLRVVRPGAEFSYHRWISLLDCPTALEQSLLGCHMLRGLKRITIDLELPYESDDTDEADESDESNESDDPDDPDDPDDGNSHKFSRFVPAKQSLPFALP